MVPGPFVSHCLFSKKKKRKKGFQRKRGQHVFYCPNNEQWREKAEDSKRSRSKWEEEKINKICFNSPIGSFACTLFFFFSLLLFSTDLRYSLLLWHPLLSCFIQKVYDPQRRSSKRGRGRGERCLFISPFAQKLKKRNMKSHTHTSNAEERGDGEK